MPSIAEVMNRELVTARASATVAEAATLMGLRGVGSVLVLEQDRLAGIFTERDIVRALSSDPTAARQRISDWMTTNPTTIGPDVSAHDGLALMLDRHFRHLPVLDGERLVGMVSIRDLSRATASG